MNTAFINRTFLKHIQDTLPPLPTTLLALCSSLETAGWIKLAERRYRKAIDGLAPITVQLPASFVQPTPEDALEAVAEIINLLTLSQPLEQVLAQIKAQAERDQGINELTTYYHTTCINEAGVVSIEDPQGFGLCIRYEPRDALAHADYLLSKRSELLQLQAQLERMWGEIAHEVKERFEAGEHNEDGLPFAEATDRDIEHILECISGQDTRGHFVKEPISLAGQWYRSLWDQKGDDTTTYGQQWTPFLRICHKLQSQEREGAKE